MNNVTELVLTKLDVMSGFKKLKVCTGYKVHGKKINTIPYDLSRVHIEPLYKTFPVWKGKLGKTLPKEALGYIKFLEKTLATKIIYVGTGPEEHDVIERYWK